VHNIQKLNQFCLNLVWHIP